MWRDSQRPGIQMGHTPSPFTPVTERSSHLPYCQCPYLAPKTPWHPAAAPSPHTPALMPMRFPLPGMPSQGLGSHTGCCPITQAAPKEGLGLSHLLAL